MGKKKIVTTSGDRSIDEIGKELSENGFVVDQVLKEVGCIIGEAADDKVDKLESIAGVKKVEDEHDVGVGPPDSSNPW